MVLETSVSAVSAAVDTPGGTASVPPGGVGVVVAGRRRIALDVVEIQLVPADADELPAWEPGAHIDVVLPEGLVRQYSLCGDPGDRGEYRIAVLRDEAGRGGSRRIHEEVPVGTRLEVRGPRNHFPFQDSQRYLFIAGGIGITPLMPMVRRAAESGVDWRLVYLGRTDDSMGYRDELRSWGDRVTLWPKDRHGRIDLDAVLGTPEDGDLVYCCGPERLLEAVEQRCASWPRGMLNIERFTAALGADEEEDTAFDVELAMTGTTLHVRADQTILEVVTEAGVYVPTSCTEGTCGSCETPVVEGEPDHRDVVLSDAEREANETMMICVGRSKCPKLVLDL